MTIDEDGPIFVVANESLSEEEMRDFRSMVWEGYAIGELTEAEAAQVLMRELELQ